MKKINILISLTIVSMVATSLVGCSSKEQGPNPIITEKPVDITPSTEPIETIEPTPVPTIVPTPKPTSTPSPTPAPPTPKPVIDFTDFSWTYDQTLIPMDDGDTIIITKDTWENEPLANINGKWKATVQIGSDGIYVLDALFAGDLEEMVCSLTKDTTYASNGGSTLDDHIAFKGNFQGKYNGITFHSDENENNLIITGLFHDDTYEYGVGYFIGPNKSSGNFYLMRYLNEE